MNKQGPALITPKETRDILASRRAFHIKPNAEEIEGEDTNRSSLHTKVSPLDFVNYLPYLCMELQLPFMIVVRRIEMGNVIYI